MMKPILLALLSICSFFTISGQVLPDSSKNSLSDTFITDTSNRNVNRLTILENFDSVIVEKAHQPELASILEKISFLNSTGNPVEMEQPLRKVIAQHYLFYIFVSFLLFFAILKAIYNRYFNNLFRIFFNTSLRQSQITDQLLQAKLPSLLFNILFTLVGGWFIYLVYRFFNSGVTNPPIHWIFYIALALGLIYFIKFIIVHFIGWVTGHVQDADTYLFVVFLVNKVMSIFLLPFVIIISFSQQRIAGAAVLLALVLVGIMFLLRFFRSYGLLRNKIDLSVLHFILYIIGIEVVPVLIIYKLAFSFVNKFQ